MRRSLLALVLSTAQSVVVAQTKPVLTPKDIGRFEGLSSVRLSSDGAWLAFGIGRGNEENELRLRPTSRDTAIVIPYGGSSGFSADSKWFASLVGVSPMERDKLLKEKKPVRTACVVRNLATGETITVAEISAFSFSASGGFVSLLKYPAEGKKSSDVVLLDLAKGTRLVFSNVTEHSWNDRRPWLAFTVQVEGGVGNGVHLFDGTSGTVRQLESSGSLYRAVAWRTKADELAVLRTVADKDFADTAHVVLTWTAARGFDTPPRVLDASSATGFPSGMRIAESRRPSWSREGTTLYLGLRPREPVSAAPRKSAEKVSDVEIWHTNDVHVIPEQRSSEQQDLRSTVLAAWHLSDGRVVRLGSDLAEPVTVLEGDIIATEVDRKPYPFGQKFGRRDQDIWSIQVATGARTKLLSKVRYVFAADPTGSRLPWFDGRDYWVADVATGAKVNLTARLRANDNVSFVDPDDDHPVDVASPVGAPTWTRDGNTLLVYSKYDIWAIAVDGSGGKRLTNGAAEGIEHRFVSLAAVGASAVDRAVDLSKPIYVSLFGSRSKRSGYARLSAAGRLERLTYGDASISGLAKADSVDRFVFQRQSFQESPNVWMAGADLANPVRLTETNPFQKDFAWGKAELMNFKSTIGVPLQAILYYPANYDPARKYPMIVYTYELLSQGLHRYITPRENDYYNANVFTQNGYFVLMPDIVFRPREPGIAVLHSVEAAVKAVIARGLVDAANIGHAGHSQGGYEAYYLATHSTLFKTAVAGAGISDMWSFAGQMHWSSVPEFDHWETGQFRMQVPPWEDPQAMMRNSPLNRVHVMPAKSVLIEIGGEDPTVDMRQGVEFYNYARRAGKDAVMLLYPGEGHGLGKRENAIDYERRILQWFAHYLKGEAPAAWITNGQTWLQRKALLDANKP